MLPNNRLSSSPVVGAYLIPDNQQSDPSRDIEYGGVALQNPIEGLLVKLWECWIENGSIYCAPVDRSVLPSLLLTAPGTTEVSIAFDISMQPTLAFVQNGVAKLRWFDTQVSSFVITEFPGVVSPRLCHDDKRAGASARSDVLLAYVKLGDGLYYRQLRDRYTVERLLRAGNFGRLRNVGMNTHNRIQFELDNA